LIFTPRITIYRWTTNTLSTFTGFFLGDAPYAFLLEILFRTVIMYAYTIFLLRVLGKRGMGQLSTLELAIIISFGSAVGDPMMGVDIPIIHGLLVITTVALLQIGMEKVINKHKKLENIMEGIPDCLVDMGVINLENLAKNELSHEDLLRSLRASQVDHLGQINKAIFETSGVISVLFLPPKHIRPGLSALPQDLIPKSWFINSKTSIPLRPITVAIIAAIRFNLTLPYLVNVTIVVTSAGSGLMTPGTKISLSVSQNIISGPVL
jgi:uncharacterized membrane protein YcaP (DUF421 family)